MNIVSLVLRIKPETRAEAEAALCAFPGVECHGMSDDGKLVVTVEDAEGAAVDEQADRASAAPRASTSTEGWCLLKAASRRERPPAVVSPEMLALTTL